MTPETYHLRLENLTLLLMQNADAQIVLEYLEARIALLEAYCGIHRQATASSGLGSGSPTPQQP